jgi:archaellum component FlaG (FlaF/FlaG flagellin family)
LLIVKNIHRAICTERRFYPSDDAIAKYRKITDFKLIIQSLISTSDDPKIKEYQKILDQSYKSKHDPNEYHLALALEDMADTITTRVSTFFRIIASTSIHEAILLLAKNHLLLIKQQTSKPPTATTASLTQRMNGDLRGQPATTSSSSSSSSSTQTTVFANVFSTPNVNPRSNLVPSNTGLEISNPYQSHP